MGIEQLFNQLTRPRLRTLLEDVYKGVTYLLDEDAYADAENDDVVRKRFIKGWEPLVEGYRVSEAERRTVSHCRRDLTGRIRGIRRLLPMSTFRSSFP